MITCVYMFAVNNFLHVHSMMQGLNQKHEEYSDNWCIGFYSSQSTDNFMCVVSILVSCHIRKHVVNFVNVGNIKRPMGHISHLRKQFKSINTYGYIITFTANKGHMKSVYGITRVISNERKGTTTTVQNKDGKTLSSQKVERSL